MVAINPDLTKIYAYIIYVHAFSKDACEGVIQILYKIINYVMHVDYIINDYILPSRHCSMFQC